MSGHSCNVSVPGSLEVWYFYSYFYTLFMFAEKKIGYIHNLSPLKRAASKCQWYEFDLQVSPTKSKRLAAFNVNDHKSIKHFEESKTPVILQDVVVKPDGDWLYTQQSCSETCPNSDVSFQYDLNFEKPSSATGRTPCHVL